MTHVIFPLHPDHQFHQLHPCYKIVTQIRRKPNVKHSAIFSTFPHIFKQIMPAAGRCRLTLLYRLLHDDSSAFPAEEMARKFSIMLKKDAFLCTKQLTAAPVSPHIELFPARPHHRFLLLPNNIPIIFYACFADSPYYLCFSLNFIIIVHPF